MNYYPNNFYQNYSSYGNMYQPQQQSQQIMQPSLQGKIVDSIDIVKANEVPFGGFGVFPKADLSEIYIKSWNNNGTTQINTYRPIPVEESKGALEVNVTSDLIEKINLLNNKLDLLMSTPTSNNNATSKSNKDKEVKINAF